MITVPEVVEELLKQTPFIEEGMSQGIINLSSLARKIKPEVQYRLYKDIQTGAIVMALKRLEKKLQGKNSPSVAVPLSDLTVRSNLAEFTFINSPTLIKKQEKLLNSAGNLNKNFLTFSYGVFETTLIVSSNLIQEVEKIFKEEILKSKFKDLSAITLMIPETAVFQPGTYYQVLKKLAWNGINIIEVISSLTELTIILENKEVDKAFSALKP